MVTYMQGTELVGADAGPRSVPGPPGGRVLKRSGARVPGLADQEEQAGELAGHVLPSPSSARMAASANRAWHVSSR